LVFDYTPNLRIVGTYHALNERDKAMLTELVEQSDFVALEYDKWRLAGKDENLIPHFWKRGYNPQEGVFYVSPFDFIYLDLFRHDVADGIESGSRKFDEVRTEDGSAESRDKRDPKQNEFKFCIDVANRLGKDVHFVDPLYKLFEDLVALDPIMKLRHMWYFGSCERQPKPVRNIIGSHRDVRMLNGVEEKEGPIKDLKRRGTLFAGLDHAVSYLEEVLDRPKIDRNNATSFRK